MQADGDAEHHQVAAGSASSAPDLGEGAPVGQLPARAPSVLPREGTRGPVGRRKLGRTPSRPVLCPPAERQGGRGRVFLSPVAGATKSPGSRCVRGQGEAFGLSYPRKGG